MIPELGTCVKAVSEGVGAVVSLDGRVPHSMLLEIVTGGGIGTLVTRWAARRARLLLAEAGEEVELPLHLFGREREVAAVARVQRLVGRDAAHVGLELQRHPHRAAGLPGERRDPLGRVAHDRTSVV